MGHTISPFVTPGLLVALGGFLAMLAAGWPGPVEGQTDRMWRPYLVTMAGAVLALGGIAAWAVTA